MPKEAEPELVGNIHRRLVESDLETEHHHESTIDTFEPI